MTTTNKLGSMMLELRNPSTPQARLSEIERLLNEFSDREEKYRSFLRFQDGKVNPAALALPFSPIYSEILSVDTASLEIPIPADYKHLLLMGSGRATGAGGAFQYMFGRYNGDSGGNYAQQKFLADDTVLDGEANTGQTGALLGGLTDGGVTAEKAMSFFTFLPHIQSNFYKTSLSLMLADYGAVVEYFVSSIWGNTDPISQITLLPVTDSFAAGSALSLYGIV